MILPTLSVVVPVYNSHRSLSILVDRLLAVLTAHTSANEIILVNDGSRDPSWEVIERLAEMHEVVRGINLMRNYGQHNALLCGIRAARYELLVTLDDDLQNPPEEIPRLLECVAQGYDVVYGTPQRAQHGLWRDVASQVTKLVLQGSMGVATARQVSAFRLFRTQVREAFAEYHSPFVSIDVLLTWGTTRFIAIPVEHEPRREGRSNYTFRKLVGHTLTMMTGFSVLPLQLASLVGFGFTLVGLGLFLFVLGRYMLEGGSVPGFPFLASIIAIFSGAQLFAIGIIGEYLARMHFRLMDRPPYVVRSLVAHMQAPASSTGGAHDCDR